MAGLLTALFMGRPIGATYADWDSFWFQKDPRWGTSASGMAMGAEASVRIGAVYACVRLLSSTVATLPLLLYRRMGEDGRERARDHYLYRMLRWQPNLRHTANEWLKLVIISLLLRGNFYSRIAYDARGRITALDPLHPDRVKAELLSSGRRGYLYRPPTGQEQTLTQEEMFHVSGMTTDPEAPAGLGVVEYARQSLGRASAEEAFAATFWNRNAEPPGALVAPSSLQDAQITQMREAWHKAHAGPQGWHNIAVLQGGVKYEKIGLSNRDAQWIESRSFSVGDIARWFGVPPHMIGDVERSTSWGAGIEEQKIGFKTFTLGDYLVAIEQAIQRDLLMDDDLYAEFLVDALERGDLASRADAYTKFVMNGIMSENEVRVRENLNPVPGLDTPQRSANQGRTDSGGTSMPPARRERPMPPTQDGEEDGADARSGAIITEAAGRLVRKEVAAIRKWAPRYAADREGWVKWASEFYGRHAGDLERVLAMTTRAAREYCTGHFESLMSEGVKITEEWECGISRHLAVITLTSRNGGVK